MGSPARPFRISNFEFRIASTRRGYEAMGLGSRRPPHGLSRSGRVGGHSQLATVD